MSGGRSGFQIPVLLLLYERLLLGQSIQGDRFGTAAQPSPTRSGFAHEILCPTIEHEMHSRIEDRNAAYVQTTPEGNFPARAAVLPTEPPTTNYAASFGCTGNDDRRRSAFNSHNEGLCMPRSSVILLALLCLGRQSTTGAPAQTLAIQILNEEADCSQEVWFSYRNLIAECSPAETGCHVADQGRRFELDFERITDFYQLDGKERPFRVLIFCPGFRIATREFPSAELQNRIEWNLTLTKLPLRRVEGIARSPTDEPIGGAVLDVTYRLLEAMSIFEYVDGSVSRIELGSIKTREDGSFEAELLDLVEDPLVDARQTTRLASIDSTPDAAGSQGRHQTLSLSLQDLYRPHLELELEELDSFD